MRQPQGGVAGSAARRGAQRPGVRGEEARQRCGVRNDQVRPAERLFRLLQAGTGMSRRGFWHRRNTRHIVATACDNTAIVQTTADVSTCPQPHADTPLAPASSAPDKRPGRARTEALPQAPPAAGAGACTAKSQPSSRRCGAARTSAATYLRARARRLSGCTISDRTSD